MSYNTSRDRSRAHGAAPYAPANHCALLRSVALVEVLVEDVVLCVFAFDFFAFFFLALCVVPVEVVSLDFIPAVALAEELLGGASVLFTLGEPVPVAVVGLVAAGGGGAVDAPVVCASAVAARQR